MEQFDHTDPIGRTLFAVFLFGSVFSYAVEKSDLVQVALNFVLIAVGLVSATNGVLKVIDWFKKRRKGDV